jgi:NDP-sugar pyrophosphorylase family protein
VAILAGGLGSRLRSVVGSRPKVVAEVAGRPFLAYVLDQVAACGFRDVLLCVGYGAEEVQAALGTVHGPLRLRYSREDSPLGTGGALRLALPLLEGDCAMVMNGDSLCDTDLAQAWAWHWRTGAEATVVLVRESSAARYGRVEVDDAGTVLSFTEKPKSRTTGWINAGIYLLSRDRIAEIPHGAAVSLERDVLPGWVGRGLHGWRTKAHFLDIGTPQSYAGASASVARRNARVVS